MQCEECGCPTRICCCGNRRKEYKDKPDTIRLGDFDIWYKPCKHCGYDTGKSRKLDDPRCWRCGKPITRDFSNRAFKRR